MTITPDGVRSEVRSTDFIKADRLLSDAEMEVREGVRGFVDWEVIPSAAEHWDRAEFPFDRRPGLGELGIMGGTFSPEYGCAGWNNVAYGLAIAELARGSGSLATFLHVQSGLAMAAIHELGREEQKQRWLPGMARCEKIGCFGLTEPDAGSDPGSLATTATASDGGYRLAGGESGIGQAALAGGGRRHPRGEPGQRPRLPPAAPHRERRRLQARRGEEVDRQRLLRGRRRHLGEDR